MGHSFERESLFGEKGWSIWGVLYLPGLVAGACFAGDEGSAAGAGFMVGVQRYGSQSNFDVFVHCESVGVGMGI